MVRAKKLIIANWKMNPVSLQDAKKLFTKTREIALANRRRVSIAVCPPAIYLDALSRLMPVYRDFYLGAQDAFFESVGPYTGEISAAILRQFSVRFVVLGHSERRAFGESDETVGRKVGAALREGLTPIACIGERSRDKDGAYLEFLAKELRFSLSTVSTPDLKKVVVAYEPLYAVGSQGGEAASPRDIFETVIFIRKFVADNFGKGAANDVRILYGGSVSEANAAGILTDAGIDGLLVGRESMMPSDFSKIVGLANIL